jgi:hypothetical protein
MLGQLKTFIRISAGKSWDAKIALFKLEPESEIS